MLFTVLRRDESVENLVLTSPDISPALAALSTARHWEYRPTIVNGTPVNVVTDITVYFQLE